MLDVIYSHTVLHKNTYPHKRTTTSQQKGLQPISSVACIISVTSPDNPGALCLFIFFSAALTTAYYCVPLAVDFVLQALLLHVTVVLVFYNKFKVLILCYSKILLINVKCLVVDDLQQMNHQE